MEPVRTLRVLEKYVSQAVFLLFVTRVLLFSHVAVDCFFRKFRKFRSYLFLASAEDEWGSQLLQLHSYTFPWRIGIMNCFWKALSVPSKSGCIK